VNGNPSFSVQVILSGQVDLLVEGLGLFILNVTDSGTGIHYTEQSFLFHSLGASNSYF
jgi:hypothetical protein